MEELRCMSELPVMYRFLSTKKEQFQFPSIDIRGFEASIHNSDCHLFADLVCRILRYIKKDNEIRIGSCDQYLRAYADEINKADILNLVKTDIKSLTSSDKLRILKWLADQTKEKNDLEDIVQDDFLGGSDPPAEMIIDVGKDSENRTYWYFDDSRLYRQKSGQVISKAGSDWQCVATDCQTWEQLIKQFSQSKDEQEQELHTYLNNHLYPVIKPLLENLPEHPSIISNEDLIRIEKEQIEGKSAGGDVVKHSPTTMDQSELIKAENPELSKVLSEEPSTAKNTANSNGDHKKSGGISFTQQQSQLFVFSTHMANRAADAVMSGAHKSILTYHLEDPDTKNFLQANPMKVSIPTSQSRLPMPPQRATNPYRQPRASVPHSQPSMQHGNVRHNMPPASLNQQMPNYYNNKTVNKKNMGGPQPDISTQMVPDEILTPDQRKSREQGLSILRNIHQMLLAENGNGQPGSMQSMTDFSHINMAQDHQGPFMSPGSHHGGPESGQFGMGQPPMGGDMMYGPPGGPPHGMPHHGVPPHGGPPHGGPPHGVPPHGGPPHGGPPHGGPPHGGPPHGGPPMSPATGNPAMMESKPPPPYPMASPGSAAPAPERKKASRKRKVSSVPSPSSPREQPPIKSEKLAIPPSPLASQNSLSAPVTPQSMPPQSMPPSHMQSAPRTPVQQAIPEDAVVPMSGPPMSGPPMSGPPMSGPPMSGPMRGMIQQQHQPLARQNSTPNFVRSNGPPNQNSFHMMQAGQPTPYQNTPIGGGVGDAPPSYNVSLRRGMSVESMTAPPSQRQQYLQPENQERVIERQINVSHQSMSSQSYTQHQAMYSSASTTNIQQSTSSHQPAHRGQVAHDSAGSNTLTNITSASLANLAKDMEQNISEMSQKMSQGGPFAEMHPHPNSANTTDAPPLEQPNSIPSSSSQQQQPSVNNTFVNAHMSIGQVNIQNVTANQTYQGPGMHGHMQQNVDVSMNNFSGAMPGGPQPDPMYKPPQQAPAAPAVSIQNKGRNTIQYLPVSQPSIAPSHDPVLPPKPSFDFLNSERFPSPSPAFMPGENPHMPMPSSIAHHQRPPSSMYSGSMSHPGHHGGHMISSGGPPGSMTMSERPGAPYMMSAQQSSMSMGYGQQPAPAGHPGMMESHQMHMRSQHMMMSNPYHSHPSMPPGAPGYAGPPGYPPQPGMPPYGHPEYAPHHGGHPMGPRGPPMQQPMMMSHQGGPYMGGPPAGPPYM